MKKVVILLIVFGLFLININTILSACSCDASYITPTLALSLSTSVFSGKVIDIEYPTGDLINTGDPIKVTLEISKLWKGPANQTLIITTAGNGATCGYPFQVNEEYLVYASGEENALTAHLCGKTKLLFEAQDDIDELNGNQNDCSAYWEGYYYDTNLNECKFVSSSGCDNPNYYTSKEECQTKNTESCTDSDGGINYLIKGEIKVIYEDGSTRTESDSCNSDGTLREWFCGEQRDPSGLLRSENFVTCPNECLEGACIQETGTGGGGSAVAECEPGKELQCWGGICTCISIPSGEGNKGGGLTPSEANKRKN